MSNPLLTLSTHPHGAIPFDQVKPEHFLPALDGAIETAKNKLEAFRISGQNDFNHVVVELDEITAPVEMISNVFHNLHSAHCPEELEKIAPQVSEKLTRFGNDISLDPIIFSKVKACFENRESQNLKPEEHRIIEISYKDFVRNGALLYETQKDELRKIDDELAKLSLQFSQNVLKATNAYFLKIKKKEDLAGLSEGTIEAAAEKATKNGAPGEWHFGLDQSTFTSFVSYSQKRELRKEIIQAYSSRAFGGELDNQENIKKILRLRHDRANLLGFKTHADYILAERMASTKDKVMEFLDQLLTKAKPFANREQEKLKALKKELTGDADYQRYDQAFYMEILKKRELTFDDETLRPYFQLEKVVSGIFKVARNLYHLDFKEVHNIPVYHPEVKTYEVYDTSKKTFIGLFYTDFFPRETKRGGAWMTNFREQGLTKGKVERPHVGIVCNFTKPTKTKPSLLTLDEVTTLFHEFGHALHGLLSNVHYRRLSGTNVYWDFVELPSQIMENWVFEKEALDLFAEHYETGEKIPHELIRKIKQSTSFMEGLATMRQLSFARLDMLYHTTNPTQIDSIEKFENETLASTRLLPELPHTNTSVAFSHIFAGGYSAGYYSYKWAEVLDADAFEYFKEKGIFDSEVAKKFREHILERGGTEHPMELYKRFRGREPKVDALLKRAGLS